ncbi:MAG: glycosyltransferase family 4 protein [Flavobacteriales bacterium]
MPKHIVLLTPGFPKNENDSTIIPALQLFVKALAEKQTDLNIKIIAFQYPFSEQKYQWHGIDVIALNGQNKRIHKIQTWLKVLKTLKRINKTEKIDVVHSFWLRECAFIGRLFTKKHKIKHLITAMGQDVLEGNRYFRFCSKHAKLITLSPFQKRILKTNYNVDSELIPWGINPREFNKTEEEKTIDILGVGSLNKVKNYPLFLRLIARLHQKGYKLNVEILGGKTNEFQALKHIKSVSLQEVIHLSGELKREDVLKKMAKAKVLLHTSTFESFGMVFIEALYSGMKIVSHQVGIAKTSPNWYVCKHENEMETALLEALKTKSENKNELRFDVNETVNSYLELYLGNV